MTAEEKLAKSISNPDLLTIVGSRLYGTERYDEQGNCISDTDKRGVIIPPWEYMTTRIFEQAPIPDELDGIIYGFGFFVKQLLSANPQHLELLFVPEDKIISISSYGRKLLDNKNLFLSKRYYKRLVGFSNSEWRKARMVELEKSNRTKTEDEVINDIKNVFGQKFGSEQKEKMDDILSILFSCHPRKEVTNNNKVSGKRKDEYHKYGYGTSSACHSIRLLRQCSELLRTGNITFPRPDAVELKDIKTGKLSFEKVESLYNDALLDVNKAEKESVLPDLPDDKAIFSFYENVIFSSLKEQF